MIKKSNEITFRKFKNKTIIITGHTGFKGSWLSLWLTLLGAKVIGISKDIPTNPSIFQAIKLKKKNCTYKTKEIPKIEKQV